MSVNERLCLFRKAARGDKMQHVVAPAEHYRLIGATEARYRSHQRVENRLEVDGRATDDPEHVTGCGKLVHRPGEVGLALAQLVEEARILDRDHRLVGEGGGQLDFLVREWSDTCAEKSEETDLRVAPQQRHR